MLKVNCFYMVNVSGTIDDYINQKNDNFFN